VIRYTGAVCGSPGSVEIEPFVLLPVGGEDTLAFLSCSTCLFDHANQITTENSVARWLHSTTLRLFPDSDYALGGHRTHDSADAPTNAQATGFHRPLRRQAYAASHLKRVGKGGRPEASFILME
jgi:hypothetical protein